MEIICPKHKCRSKNIDYETLNFYHSCTCLECDWKFLIPYRPEEGCCNNQFAIDVIHRFDFDSHVIYEQCINCGWTKKSKPKKMIDANIRGEYDKERNEEWHERKSQEYKWFNDNIKIQNDFWIKYNIYLASDKWKSIRLKVFERDSNLCQMCKIKEAEQVHHLTYENLRNEKMEDLMAVCTECHELHHKELKQIEK